MLNKYYEELDKKYYNIDINTFNKIVSDKKNQDIRDILLRSYDLDKVKKIRIIRKEILKDKKTTDELEDFFNKFDNKKNKQETKHFYDEIPKKLYDDILKNIENSGDKTLFKKIYIFDKNKNLFVVSDDYKGKKEVKELFKRLLGNDKKEFSINEIKNRSPIIKDVVEDVFEKMFRNEHLEDEAKIRSVDYNTFSIFTSKKIFTINVVKKGEIKNDKLN